MIIRPGLPASVRVIIISFFLFFLAISYGRGHFYRDPGSIFFDITRAFERYYSLVREFEASDWKNDIHHILKGHSPQSPHDDHPKTIYKKGERPRICTVFLTAHMEGGPQYVDVAISSALAGLTPSERKDLDVRLYIANTDPTTHPAWQSWLENVVDETFTAKDNVYPSKMQHLFALERDNKFREKSSLDYSVALQRCATNSSAPYVAVFEGDTLLADGWMARAMLGLKDIKEKFEMNRRMWLYMRLFNEERSSGWASNGLFENNVLWISLGVDVVVCIVAFLLRRHSRRIGPLFTPLSTIIICIFTVPGFVILFFQAGKASVLPPQPGLHRQDGFGCCSQGLIFPREVVADLASYLEEKSTSMPYDNAMMEYSRRKRLALFALYPMSVQHVGFSSIINPHRTDTIDVWSMAFENQSPKQLALEHERNVKAYYGPDAWTQT